MKKVSLLLFALLYAISVLANTPSPAIAWNGVSGKTIANLDIVPSPGKPMISLSNCDHITIQANSLNGRCTPASDQNLTGIQLYRCHDITIVYNVIKQVASGVCAIQCTGNIQILSNQFQNMTGPFPRGEAVQLNGCSGAGLAASFNIVENIAGQSYSEDCFSTYNSSGVPGSPITYNNNWIRCGGNLSSSGSGIMLGDGGGSYQTAKNNVMVNPGHVQIGIAGGVADSVYNNICLTNDVTIKNPIGIQAANYGPSATCGGSYISGNQVSCFKTPYWFPGTCSFTQSANNYYATLTPAILPSVLIGNYLLKSF